LEISDDSDAVFFRLEYGQDESVPKSSLVRRILRVGPCLCNIFLVHPDEHWRFLALVFLALLVMLIAS
jgi:hypothetical protein